MAKTPKPPKCMECGEIAHITTGRVIYPHREDLHELPFWQCRCGAYTGCHKGTQHPKGRPAVPATRKARKAAHAAFDPLWKRKAERDSLNVHHARAKGYKWLAAELGVQGKACHIGDMDARMARRVVAICRAVSRPG